MNGPERRVHVYQNGIRTVAKLYQTRLGSSSLPPTEAFSPFTSRPTPITADDFSHKRDQPFDTSEPTANSPFSFAALDFTDVRQKAKPEGAELTITSPLPQPPSAQPTRCPQPGPSCALSNSTNLRHSVVSDGCKSRLPSSSASGVRLHSSQGLSQSPQLPHVSNSGMTSGTPPLATTSFDAQPPWPHCAFVTVGGGVNDIGDTIDNHSRESNLENNEQLALSSPLLVSCDVSCITRSPAEHQTPGVRISSLPSNGILTEQMYAIHASSGAQFGNNDEEKEETVARPTLTCRSREVSLAERVLFNDDDEDVEWGEGEEENRRRSSAVERSANTPLQRCGDLPQRPFSQGPSAGVSLGIFQAHTPPRLVILEQQQPNGPAAERGVHTRLHGDNSVNDNDSGNASSTLSCTCVPGNASFHNGTNGSKISGNNSSQTRSTRHCLAAASSNTTVATINAENNSALSATAPNLSSIAPSRNGDYDGSKCAAVAGNSSGDKVVHPVPQKSVAEFCGDQDERTPPGVTTKVMPTDVEVHAATPMMTRGYAEDTPTPTPHRRELLCQLLVQAVSATLHTPRTFTLSSSSAAALASGASPQTPTPHPSRRFSSSPASWEGLTQITGFPTPVKLSPIPTKAYAMHAELTASAAADITDGGVLIQQLLQQQQEQPPAAAPCTSSKKLASPTLSSIDGEERFRTPELPPPLSGVGSLDDTAKANAQISSGRENDAVKDTMECSSADAVVAERDAENTTDYTSPAEAQRSTYHQNTSFECSISPIRVRAAQTTRVWTPHSGDISHAQLPPLSSLSCITFTQLGAATSRYTGKSQTTFLSNKPVNKPIHVDASTSAHFAATALSASGQDENTVVTERNVKATSVKRVDFSSQPSPQLSQCTSFRRSVPSPDPQHGEAAATDNAVEASSTGRASPHFVIDTLNLGTPTVSVIHSPAQALNESCSFLMPPSSAPYIQALPIPGMRCNDAHPIAILPPKRLQTGAKVPLQSDDSGAKQLWLCLDEEQHSAARHAPLLSPSLESDDDDHRSDYGRRKGGYHETNSASGAGNVKATDANASAKARQRRFVPLMSPFETNESIAVAEERGSGFEEQRSTPRVTCGTQTCQLFGCSASAPLTSTMMDKVDVRDAATSMQDSLRKNLFVSESQLRTTHPTKGRDGLFFSSVESVPQCTSRSWVSTATSQRYQRSGLSPSNDGHYGSKVEEEEGAYSASYRHSVGAKSFSSTRFIDSWL